MITDQLYKIKLPEFEGPMDLLLHLINQNKVDIYDIPISLITGQYLEYLEFMKELDLEVAGNFLVMAATLIQIKSKMMLPPDEETGPEEMEDPRFELVQRLLEYQAYKDAATILKEKEDEALKIFGRQPEDLEEEKALVPELSLFDVNIFDLLTALKKLFENAPSEMLTISRETLTVKDKMMHIADMMANLESMRFEELFMDTFSRMQLIVTFLALLELLRLGLARVYQEKEFGNIWIINPHNRKISGTEQAAVL